MSTEPKMEAETETLAATQAMEATPAEKTVEAAPVEKTADATPVEKSVEVTPLEKTIDATPAEKPMETILAEKLAETTLVEKRVEVAPAENPVKKHVEISPEVAMIPEQAKAPLLKLFSELPKTIANADHREMWGVKLTDSSSVPTTIILQKFLRANNDDAVKAQAQLLEALKWRKQMDPLKLLADVEHDKHKFGNLGYVTTYNTSSAEKEIMTWNIYGAVKDIKGTFDNVDEFIKWRTALMELSIKELNLASATEKIPDGGPDPYRMIQVHDYLNVSFLRMDPSIRAASKAAIQIFAMAYPELVKEKFFVNLPLAMGWVFAALRLFLSAETIKKFHPLSYGGSLAGEIPGIGEQLPEVYGGKGTPLTEHGLVVKYAAIKEPEPEPKPESQ